MDDQTLLAHLARDLDGSFESLMRAHQGRLYVVDGWGQDLAAYDAA